MIPPKQVQRATDVFVEDVGEAMRDVIGRLPSVDGRRISQDVATEAFHLVTALIDVDRSHTDDELWGLIFAFGKWMPTQLNLAKPDDLRRSSMLVGRAAWLDQISPMFEILVSADRKFGTANSRTYYDRALHLAFTVAALEAAPSRDELTAIETADPVREGEKRQGDHLLRLYSIPYPADIRSTRAMTLLELPCNQGEGNGNIQVGIGQPLTERRKLLVFHHQLRNQVVQRPQIFFEVARHELPFHRLKNLVVRHVESMQDSIGSDHYRQVVLVNGMESLPETGIGKPFSDKEEIVFQEFHFAGCQLQLNHYRIEVMGTLQVDGLAEILVVPVGGPGILAFEPGSIHRHVLFPDYQVLIRADALPRDTSTENGEEKQEKIVYSFHSRECL